MPGYDHRPTRHRYDVDLTQFLGQMVLGEPRAVLASALLRLRILGTRDGMAEFGATMPQHEADALVRAMEQVEEGVPDDPRTGEQRDCDRLLAVIERVLGGGSIAPDG